MSTTRRDAYTNGDGLDIDLTSAGPEGEAAPTYSYPVVLGTAVVLQTRQKTAVAALLVHWLVVSLAIGSDECASANLTAFAVYWACLLLAAAAWRFVTVRHLALTGTSPAERITLALGESLLTTVHLFAVVLLRAKPVKCYTGVGMTLAYAVAPALLMLVHALMLCTEYVRLRTLAPAQLMRLSASPTRKHN